MDICLTRKVTWKTAYSLTCNTPVIYALYCQYLSLTIQCKILSFSVRKSLTYLFLLCLRACKWPYFEDFSLRWKLNACFGGWCVEDVRAKTFFCWEAVYFFHLCFNPFLLLRIFQFILEVNYPINLEEIDYKSIVWK